MIPAGQASLLLYLLAHPGWRGLDELCDAFGVRSVVGIVRAAVRLRGRGLAEIRHGRTAYGAGRWRGEDREVRADVGRDR